ncbi:MAG: hypothetical protein HY722_05175 [Planctomycetes bacterium]|nr:hypothetical protein [Planctomycetota bacterium]
MRGLVVVLCAALLGAAAGGVVTQRWVGPRIGGLEIRLSVVEARVDGLEARVAGAEDGRPEGLGPGPEFGPGELEAALELTRADEALAQARAFRGRALVEPEEATRDALEGQARGLAREAAATLARLLVGALEGEAREALTRRLREARDLERGSP